MIQLNWWEQFIVGAAVTLLTGLLAKVTNPTEKAALQAAIDFLTGLLNGQATKLVGLPPAPPKL
jgi:hypothetical protein